MKKTSLFILSFGAAVGLVAFAARNSEATFFVDPPVSLQAVIPGVVEGGNINVSGVIKGGAIRGNGSGLTSLKASAITSDLLADARLTPNVALQNRLNTFVQPQRIAKNLLMTSQSATILFPAVTIGNPAGMMTMFASGTGNNNRMVIAHSPGLQNWGLQYEDGNDIFRFLGGGTSALTVDLGNARVGVATEDAGIMLAIGDADSGFEYIGGDVIEGRINGNAITYMTPDGFSSGTGGPQARLHGRETSPDRPGVLGIGNDTAISAITDSFFYRAGVEGAGRNGFVGAGVAGIDGYGVVGIAPDSLGRGVMGRATSNSGSNYGVYGESFSGTNGYGVFAAGRTGASGTKSFRIDHPADPANKYLLHYSAEGPEPLNIYSGAVLTGPDGYVTVPLPSYYEDINRDARIQLTVEDAGDDFVMAKVVRGVKDGAFVIRTSQPSVKVYWEVKAIRNDRFVQQYGAPVEKDKPAGEKGRYQHPELYGYGPEMGYRQGAAVEKKKL